MKPKPRYLLLTLVSFIVMTVAFSCSGDNGLMDEPPLFPVNPGDSLVEEPTEDDTIPMPRIQMKVVPRDTNMLCMTTFYLADPNGEILPWYSSQYDEEIHLSMFFDSIVWTVDGLSGRLPIYEYSPWRWSCKTMWSNSFLYPGEYTTHLIAYKHGSEVYRYTTTFTQHEGDFLGWNWDETDKLSEISTRIVHDLVGPNYMTTTDYELSVSIDHSQGVPYFRMHYTGISDPLFDERKEMTAYITHFYGEPDYVGQDVATEKFDELFTIYDTLLERRAPVCIWLTEKNKIVLLEDREYPTNTIFVLVEENVEGY